MIKKVKVLLQRNQTQEEDEVELEKLITEDADIIDLPLNIVDEEGESITILSIKDDITGKIWQKYSKK